MFIIIYKFTVITKVADLWINILFLAYCKPYSFIIAKFEKETFPY